MRLGKGGAQVGFALLIAVSLASAAVAQTPDETAQVIQDNIAEIQVQIRVAPAAAQEDLQRQKEQLETLRREAPHHPLLRSLERRIDELDQEITVALQEQPEAGQEAEQFVPLNVPAEVRRELREVETLQTRADRDLMRGAADSAAELLSQAEAKLKEIEAEYGDRIPPGYAALIVAQERGAALQDQLARTAQEE